MSSLSYLPSSYDLDASRDLPSYAAAVPAPRYSFEPACDEQRLQLTPQSSASRTPTGTFIKNSGKTTVVLVDQEEDVELPTYGRRGPIHGTVLLEEPETITEVEVKIEGKVDVTISEAGGKTTQLVKQRHVLWNRDASGRGHCPSQLAFAYPLPATFHDGREIQPLPPSYQVFCRGVPTLFLKTTYTIRVAVTRIAHQKLGGLWTKTKHILIPFNYAPRTRAHRPIHPMPAFFSSIKTSPEEWYQATSTVKARDASSLTPLDVQTFIPAGRVYGIKDTIPFHLQLSGRVSSLRQLFASCTNLDRVTSADSHRTASSSLSIKDSESDPIIRVYLMRQITVELRGQKAWRNVVLGEGTLTSVPPLMTSCYCPSSSSRTEHLDWEGELRCDDDVIAANFTIGNTNVKEFVIVNISPLADSKTQLHEMQVSIPIRIVTDSYGEVPMPDAQ
ncbi:hypothetical protein NMY22_g11974 [Coprinellus aureogranulatus]|nr:hypothetical protein NMY22_g11974 [Coprinellus aureogranulatus]